MVAIAGNRLKRARLQVSPLLIMPFPRGMARSDLLTTRRSCQIHALLFCQELFYSSQRLVLWHADALPFGAGLADPGHLGRRSHRSLS
jgi:hypothetical protein